MADGAALTARPRAVPLPRPDLRGLHLAARRGGVPRLRRRRHRPAGLPARRRAGPRPPARLGEGPRAALPPPPRQGRVLGLRDRHRRPGGLAGAGLHAQARHRRDVREARRDDAARPRARAPRLRQPQRALARRRRSSRRASWGCPTTPSRSRRCTAWASPIKHAVRELGLRLREYAPVGELIPGMAYLVRRLLENTANDSFLRQTFVEGAAVDELVRAPATSADFGREPARRPVVAPTDPEAPAPFANQPRADFSRRELRDEYDAALAAVRGRLGAHHPLVIGGREIDTAKRLTSVNPARPAEVIGTVAYGGRAEAEAAVAAARAAQAAWRDTPARERAGVLFRAAELMRREVLELSALMTLEAGKTRREADGDVDEAIDFLEYYGREMLRLDKARRTGGVPGEHNVLLLRAARRRPRRRALELPAGDPHRHDERGARRRQSGDRQAGGADAGRRRPDGPHPRRGGSAARHGQLPAQPGRRGRRLPRPPRRRRPHRLHRLDGRRPRHHQSLGAEPRPGRRQEGHRRDGRQERRDRRRRRRPRRGRRRDRGLGLPLRRAEVLGRLARDRARGGLRRLRAPPRRGHAQPPRRPAGGARHARRPRDLGRRRRRGSSATSRRARRRPALRRRSSRRRAAGPTTASTSPRTSSSTSRPPPSSPRRRSSARSSR